ncbi:potassium/proton antiporter [Maricaulis maris]|uniref:Sodium/hydrogen exchanger family protein n=1 Tax=Maricaulis maris TaxID=74318 RepID=A0A495DF47_9PROT|nr:potassium/proton antiporter [Maricaulis maris]RKR00074.1 sodium/hydrogen exchanger family protein [Maricaulis maris]
MNETLFLFSLVIVFSILLIPLSTRFRAPILLIFLIIGMLFGEDGPGGILFEDFDLTYQAGSICLALILLSGGLDTRSTDVRAAALPAGLLAGPGVILTAVLVGCAYALVFDASIIEGLLFGAVVSSTDAAATFMALRDGGVTLARRPRQTLLVESGINDPMAIFLTVMMVEIVDSGLPLSLDTMVQFMPVLALQLGLGLAIGICAGWLAARLMGRIKLPTGVRSPLLLAMGLLAYSGTGLLGGSGFLAVYLFGLGAANFGTTQPVRAIHFHEGLSWIAQICLFVLLGLLVTPSALGEVLLPGLILAAVLMLVVRPVSVIACLMPLGVPLREQIYVGWMGMRGSVPIFLAILPVVSPGPITAVFFNLVFVIVVISLLVHGLTAALSARWLGVETDRAPEPDTAASECDD